MSRYHQEDAFDESDSDDESHRRRRAWTEEEDAMLEKLVNENGGIAVRFNSLIS